jgi:hypothetical protein
MSGREHGVQIKLDTLKTPLLMSMQMKEALIRFEGEKFYGVKWDHFLRDMGFRVSGGCREKAVYASGGNSLVVQSQMFVKRLGQQGYEWKLILKQTRRWEGMIKFYSVLLAAFAMPQDVKVTLADNIFTDRKALRAYAETSVISDFSVEELTDNGVYRKGDGIRFG